MMNNFCVKYTNDDNNIIDGDNITNIDINLIRMHFHDEC